MNPDGQLKKDAMVQFERLLPGPIERVWAFVTDPKKLPGWFGEGSIEPRPGGAVSLMGGHVRGIVTRWQPPRRLTYSWNVFAAGETLTIELEPRGSEVALTLTHLPVLERFEKQNAMGWHTFLDMLGAAVRGEATEPRQAYMQRNAARYGVDVANLVR
jgi:uncharacterized protein YndB with AHSA1/START domain